MSTKYRITKNSGWFDSGFSIEKYTYLPDGPLDFNGMPESLEGWFWVKCNEYDIPDIYKKLNAD